jgi:hypothetical protein
MNSKVFTLIKSDFVKAGLMFVLGAVLNFLYSYMVGGNFDLFAVDWMGCLKVGLNATVLYLVKNFFTDAEGKFLGKIG